MQDTSAWLLALTGLCIGTAAGFFVRLARLCSFGAVEDALMGGDTRRLRIFGLALGIALIGTQALVIGGAARSRPDQLHRRRRCRWPSILIGSVLFGVGMAMVGTCGFGSLVRLGAGDLRSFVVILVLGGAAYATLRGVFSGFRITVLEQLAVAMPEGVSSDLASLTRHLLGIDLRGAIAAIGGGVLCLLAFGDKRLRRTPRLLTAGVALGAADGGRLARDDEAGRRVRRAGASAKPDLRLDHRQGDLCRSAERRELRRFRRRHRVRRGAGIVSGRVARRRIALGGVRRRPRDAAPSRRRGADGRSAAS